jgi:hypothetical protein
MKLLLTRTSAQAILSSALRVMQARVRRSRTGMWLRQLQRQTAYQRQQVHVMQTELLSSTSSRTQKPAFSWTFGSHTRNQCESERNGVSGCFGYPS